jgi:hypothetical protein
MATWPNTTISTANVDAGNDLPRLARADIKDTIDAVNLMINNAPQVSVTISLIETDTANLVSTEGANRTYRFGMNKLVDTGDQIVTFSVPKSTNDYYYRMTLGPGTYKFEATPTRTLGSTAGGAGLLPNFVSLQGNAGISISSFGTGDGIGIIDMEPIITLTANSTYECRATSTLSSVSNRGRYVTITKLA